VREEDQELTTKDMAGRGSAPAHDRASEPARQDAPAPGGLAPGGLAPGGLAPGGPAGAHRDGAPGVASATPSGSDRPIDQPGEAARQPQAGSQPSDLTGGDERGELMGRDQANEFQERWRQVQSRFVDDPRVAVQEADALVAETMQALAAGFAEERRTLEAQWSRSEGEAATEQLRQALRRYRSFFERLLST